MQTSDWFARRCELTLSSACDSLAFYGGPPIPHVMIFKIPAFCIEFALSGMRDFLSHTWLFPASKNTTFTQIMTIRHVRVIDSETSEGDKSPSRHPAPGKRRPHTERSDCFRHWGFCRHVPVPSVIVFPFSAPCMILLVTTPLVWTQCIGISRI